MNKISLLINKITTFSNNAINKYKLKKLTAAMSLDDFIDNNVVYNTSSEDSQVSGIKTKINSLIDKMSGLAGTIEDVITGKNPDKREFIEAVKEFSMAYSQFEKISQILDSMPNIYERFMVDEDDGTLDIVGLVDFMTNAYDAVDGAVSKYAGVPIHKISELYGEAEQQALESADPGADGMQHSSTDQTKRDALRFFKEKMREARQAEKSIPGYKSPVLQKIRAGQKRYFDELRADPERWSAFKKLCKEGYERRHTDRRAAFDIVLRKISYKLLKYNLISQSEVEKIMPITIHNLLPRLLSIISDEKELKDVESLKRDFDAYAEKLQFDKRLLQQRDSYRAKVQSLTKEEDSIIGQARRTNMRLNSIKLNKKQEIEDELIDLMSELKKQLQIAMDSGNKEEVKNIEKDIKTLVSSHPAMIDLESDLNAMKNSIKKAVQLYPRGSTKEQAELKENSEESGKDPYEVPDSNKKYISQVLILLKETSNVFGARYKLTSHFDKLIKAVELQQEIAMSKDNNSADDNTEKKTL